MVILAVVALVATVFFLGLDGLIPFGLLLAFSTGTDEEGTKRAVGPTPRNFALAAAMMAAFAGFWLGYSNLDTSMLVMIAGALIALPLALRESEDAASSGRTVTVTKRSLVLALWALVFFAYLYKDSGLWLDGLTAVCVILPLTLAASRAWAARRGRIELGLLRHPLHRQVRPHLVQGLNIWLCCGLLGGVIAAGGMHYARIGYPLSAAQFDAVFWVFAAGIVLLAVLALVPRRRVQVATNVAVALFSVSSLCSSSSHRSRPPKRSNSTPHWSANGSYTTAAAASCSPAIPWARKTLSTSRSLAPTGAPTPEERTPL